jgi:hypothetical protein
VAVTLVLGGIGALSGGSSDSGSSSNSESSDQPATSPTTQAEATTEAEPSSPKAQITAVAEDQFGDKLKKVEVTKQVVGPNKGSYFVSTTFNEPTGLTGGTTKLEIGNEMRDAYPALFDSDVDVSKARITGNVRLVNKFGHKSWGPGWITEITAEKAKKVDWDYFQDVAQSPPWDVIYLRPDL